MGMNQGRSDGWVGGGGGAGGLGPKLVGSEPTQINGFPK